METDTVETNDINGNTVSCDISLNNDETVKASESPSEVQDDTSSIEPPTAAIAETNVSEVVSTPEDSRTNLLPKTKPNVRSGNLRKRNRKMGNIDETVKASDSPSEVQDDTSLIEPPTAAIAETNVSEVVSTPEDSRTNLLPKTKPNVRSGNLRKRNGKINRQSPKVAIKRPLRKVLNGKAVLKRKAQKPIVQRRKTIRKKVVNDVDKSAFEEIGAGIEEVASAVNNAELSIVTSNNADCESIVTSDHVPIGDHNDGVQDVLKMDGKELKQNLDKEIESSLDNLKSTPDVTSSPMKMTHYQTLMRFYDRSVLHSALKVGQNEYLCPVCGCRKNHVGHMILHIRAHKDLGKILELCENIGGEKKSDPKEPIIKRRRRKVVIPGEGPGKRLRQRATNPAGFSPLHNKVHVRERNRKTKFGNFLGTGSSNDTSEGDVKLHPVSVGVRKFYRSGVIKKFNRKKKAEKVLCSVRVMDIAKDSELSAHPDADPKALPDEDLKVLPIPVKRRRMITNKAPVKRNMEFKLSSRLANFSKVHATLAAKKRSPLSEEISAMLKRELVGKVSADNPHICRFCGKVFYHSAGVHYHYTKHARMISKPKARKSLSRKQASDGLTTQDKPFDRAEYAFDELVIALKREEQETEAGVLKVLGDDVNILIGHLVRDDEVLKCLGWPNRNAGDLIIDILERCDLQPSRERLNIISPLQCLRKNVYELLTFCIKERAMEDYGWNCKSVDEVVKEMIEKENVYHK